MRRKNRILERTAQIQVLHCIGILIILNRILRYKKEITIVNENFRVLEKKKK
jgi:hypothetical protein